MGAVYVTVMLTMFLKRALHGMDATPIAEAGDETRAPDLGPMPPATSRRADVR